MTLGYRRLYIG